jgi:hypothetical protein
MSRFGLLWLTRMAAIGLLGLLHFGLLTSVLMSDIGGLLSRGPDGKELGHIYRESPTGRRNSTAIEALSWPIIKPVTMINSRLGGSTSQSTPWRTFAAAASYANSLAWGIGLWLILEGLVRGTYHPFQRVLRSTRSSLPGHADDANPHPPPTTPRPV